MRSPRSVTFAPIGMPSTDLEARDRLLGARDRRLLTRDDTKVLDGRVELLAVLNRGADAHVDDDLLQARNLVDVLKGELLLESCHDLVSCTSL